MGKEDLIKQSRYYRGEVENPYSDDRDGMFWSYERIWVEKICEMERDGDGVDAEFIREHTEEYRSMGLGDFEGDDGTPITLKALLLNRLFHWYEYCTVEDFKVWYVDEYRNRERR